MKNYTFLTKRLYLLISFLLCLGVERVMGQQCGQSCSELIGNSISATLSQNTFTTSSVSFNLTVSSLFSADQTVGSTYQSNYSTPTCPIFSGNNPSLRVQIAKQATFGVYGGFFTESSATCVTDVINGVTTGNVLYNQLTTRPTNSTIIPIGLSGLSNGTYTIICRIGSSTAGSKFVQIGTFTVNIPTTCTISSLSPTSASPSTAGGNASFTVNATNGQSWTVAESVPWITLTTTSGSGTGTVNYSTSSNTGASRAGDITVTCGADSKIFTVSQAGSGPPPTCTISLSSSSGNIASTNGSSGSFTVTSSGSWTVSDNVTWLNTSQSGNTVNFSATSANSSASPRNAIITVDCGGITQTYTLTQDGTAPPANNLTVSNTNVNFTSATAGSQTITINSTNVNWTATESISWITISPSSGANGSTTFTINVSANTGAARNGTISIIGGSFNLSVNVSQVANPGPVCFTIGNVRVCADASTNVSAGVETLSGNIKIFLNGSTTNAVMTSTGSVTINTNNATISGSGGIKILNILGYGTVDLIAGNFNFSITQSQLNRGNTTINNLFKLIGLDIEIDKISVISNGILLEGKMNLPSIWKGAKAQITQISITTSGIGVNGVTCLPNMIYGGLNLKEACLQFNTVASPNRFQGNIKADVGIFKGNITGSTEIFSGNYGGVQLTEVNKFQLSYTPITPIPIGTTGLGLKKMTGGGYNISGIATNKNPMYAELVTDMQSLDPLKTVELSNFAFKYTFGQSFEARAENLKIFGQPIATASVLFDAAKIDLRAKANFTGMIRGDMRTTLSYGNSVSFLGGIKGDFYTPSQSYLSQVNIGDTWLQPLWDAAVTLFPSTSSRLGSTFGLLTLKNDLAQIEGGATVSVNLGTLLGTWKSDIGYRIKWLGGFNFNTSLFTDYKSVENLQSQVTTLLAFNKKNHINDDYYSTYASGDKMALPPPSYQYFEVVGNNREVIIGASGTSSPIFNIEFPNGTIITANNFQNYTNVNYVDIPSSNNSY